MTNNDACRLVGCEFPLFAFSHCRDVVAAVSRAGGFGVLGGSGFTPAQLEVELSWIDAHVGDRPYGVDILIPEHMALPSAAPTLSDFTARIPVAHRQFAARLLQQCDIACDDAELLRTAVPSITPDLSAALLDVAFRHPIRLIANALGIAPPQMIERGRRHGVPVAALVGAKEHALRQAAAGVDIIVAQGGEAGGHCGDVSTLVLVPEVLRALDKAFPGKKIPVLAAGGIMTGRQMAGCMALGASGAWTGSVWLATVESETSASIKEKLLAAGSRDTVRSKYRTGKPSRQLRSVWHDAWEAQGAPAALPMPLMSILAEPVLGKIERAADSGNVKAKQMTTYWVGQGVGLIEAIDSAANVVRRFKEEFADALSDLQAQVQE